MNRKAKLVFPGSGFINPDGLEPPKSGRIKYNRIFSSRIKIEMN